MIHTPPTGGWGGAEKQWPPHRAPTCAVTVGKCVCFFPPASTNTFITVMEGGVRAQCLGLCFFLLSPVDEI